MNRRRFVMFMPAMGFMASCSAKQHPSSNAALPNDPGVEAALNAVDSTIDSLERVMERFDMDENWKDAIPDAETLTMELRNRFDKLRDELGV